MTDDQQAQACAAAFKPLAEMGKTLNLAEQPGEAKIKRFFMATIDEACNIAPDMVESPDGPYVLFTDYATLSAQLAAMREVLAEARGHHNTACQHTAGRNCNCDWCKKTDAALARAAALGVK